MAYNRRANQRYVDNDDDDDDEQQQQQQQRYGTDDDDDEETQGQARRNRRGYVQQGNEEEEEEEEVEEDDGEGEEVADDDDDDENEARGVGQEEEEEEEEEEPSARAHPHATYQTVNKPQSDPNTDPDELCKAAMIVMKHLMIQTHNAQGVAAGTHNHQSVMESPGDAHPNGDWRIQYLQTQDADGNAVTLEAKMDTGADANWVCVEACETHGLEIEEPGPGAPTFTVGSGQQTGVDGQVFMRYSAGNPPKRYAEQFWAKEDLPHDIILGMPFLLHSHAITLNPSFASKQSSGDFLLMETTPASNKTQEQRQNFAAAAAARKQANAAARKAKK